jgi:predicted MFS family arabinose efflux permease
VHAKDSKTWDGLSGRPAGLRARPDVRVRRTADGQSRRSRRARTFGSIVWAFDTGIGTGSLVIGVLGEHLGLSFAFKVAAALSCFSIPIFAWASRHLASRGTSLAADLEHARTD